MKSKTKLSIIIMFFFFSFLIYSVAAKNVVNVDLYYSAGCRKCDNAVEEVNKVIEYYGNDYSGILFINKIEVGSNSTNRAEMRSHNMSYPSVRIYNNTHEKILPEYDVYYEELTENISKFLAGTIVDNTYDPNVIMIPFFGKINASHFSLPVLTILLGGLDSFNPCSFFILIFLLNLLFYLRSRKRMFLVGGIFIFFSGFFYFIFMFVLFNSLLLTAQHVATISLLAGLVAILIGIINIKDFFFSKKGVSLSIPESKRLELFKKMRHLIKTSYLPAVIGGTIFLAITVNFYELLCTLGFPLIFTNRLTLENIPLFQQYTYIFFYNVVYVIPLIIILLIFTYTLGRRKLSEWEGKQLKLLSGIMIFSFGILFIVDYKLLENVITPILLLAISIASTLIIARIMKLYEKESEEGDVEKEPPSQ